MKGYISVTDYDTRTTIYINVSTIASISDWDVGTRIKITFGEWYNVRESVSEVCQKMKSALDSDSIKSVSVETTSNGWINVQDHLPDDGDYVQIGYKSSPDGSIYRDCIAYRACGRWHLAYNGNIIIGESVVAWKPMNDAYSIKDLWRCEE